MPRPYASAIINAPVDQVWSYVRDFGNLAEWLPAIEACDLEDGGSGVGAVRRVTAPGGVVFRERLVALSDLDHTLTYDFLESPLPVRNLHATIRLAPVTDTGATFAEWWGVFNADASDEESMTGLLAQGVYRTGLEALQKRFG